MLITRKSQVSGEVRTLDIPCTQEQYDAYMAGKYIQVAMPNISPDEREFIISGVTLEEWNDLFPPEEDD